MKENIKKTQRENMNSSRPCFFISHMFSNTSSELLTVFTTQQHPIAIPGIFHCGFDRKFRRHFFGSMGGDDRTKGDGFQTQKRKGFRAGQVRNDELLVELLSAPVCAQ